MNGQHFQAFLWLRWRLLINQLRRGGTTNFVILTIMAVGAVVLAIGTGIAAFFVGLFALADQSPDVLLYVWDGLVVAFLFTWMIGLLQELQRSEVLSLEKFLHLPVSLKGVFLINYLSSLFNVTLLIFLPGMTTLSLALAISKGPMLLLLFPLLAGFVFMVTAVTFQFQGWLASLMVNPRRRRTVIVVVTMFIVLVCNLPNLVNVLQPWNRLAKQKQEIITRLHEELAENARSFQEKKISVDEYSQRQREIQQKMEADLNELDERTSQRAEEVTWLLNVCLPPGWLALGAMAAAQGHVLTALLAAGGLTLIGAVSLGRSYQTTVRLYTGHFTARKKTPVAIVAAPKTGKPSVTLLERKLPWLSEQASVVALGGFRSLLRAPEAKMMLLSPLIMVVVFGSIFLANSIVPPPSVRPVMAFGALAMILLSMAQFVGNPFGFDRSGFRVFVLSAVPRRDILLGKNMACAPFALGIGAVVIAGIQVIAPLQIEDFLAVAPQAISMFLLLCMLGNWLSIFAPVRLRSGSSQPANMRGVPILLHFLFVFTYPMILAPTLLPCGIQIALHELGVLRGVPINLLLSLAECAVVIWLYRVVVNWQGDLLQGREQKILEIVTTRTE